MTPREHSVRLSDERAGRSRGDVEADRKAPLSARHAQ
jgi:hypothetical protein